MIRVAAVADLHFGTDSAGTLEPCLEELQQEADAFVIAGDLTRHGSADEAVVLAREIGPLSIPVVAVLGNHDYHRGEEKAITDVMAEAGVKVLEGEAAVLELDGGRLGIAGHKGFGGGFVGACGSDYGEPEMKAFVRHTKAGAERLRDALEGLEADHKVVTLHYSPVEDTLRGERLEIYPFLGSYLLAEAIDAVGADLIFHGHAHAGSEKGVTPGGVPVRNVAQHVIRCPYNVYCFGTGEDPGC